MNIKGSIAVFRKYLFLLGQLVSREIKLRYQRSVLGIAWSVLNPLLMMLILNVVFSNLFRMDIPNYLVFYLTGSLIFSFLSEATGGSLTSIIGNAGLIKKVYIPKYIFPMAKVTSAFVNFGFSLIALALVCAFTGVVPSPVLLLALPFFLVLYVFVLGLSLIFAAYTVFFRDLVHIHAILMMIWMYITPIIYPEKILPEQYAWILKVNPLYPYIRVFRDMVLYGNMPSAGLFAACALLAALSLAAGLVIFKRNQDKFMLYF
jgi:ABC-2 type transport system permease protein